MAVHFMWYEILGANRDTDRGRTIALACMSVVIALLVNTVLYRIFLHPLSHVPGPLIAKMTGLWRTGKYMGGKWHDDILEIHRKFGRVVRIAPNEISVVDEHAMKNLYGHGHNAPKTDWYTIWNPPNTAPQLFSELDKKYHSFLRKRLAGAYSMSSVLKYEEHIQSCLDLLLDRLHKHADAGEVVDMAVWTNAFAFDVIGELGFGSQLGHLREEKDVGQLRKTIFDIFKLLSSSGHLPRKLVLSLLSTTQAVSGVLGVESPMVWYRNWSAERVQHRLDNMATAGREDLLNHFCRMKDQNGNPASFGEILIEAMNLVGAGADTTSIGMRTCLYFVTINPDVYEKLRDEVDAFYEGNKLGSPITYLDTQKLPYLQAVIKEATRLLPSIVFQLLRHTPPDFEVRGMKIPANTPIGISPIAQNRDREIWGQDADEFRPQRWLDDEERTKYFDRSIMTFGGSGPRMCIGRNIALVELHKFLAQFVRNFSFELVNKERPWRISTYWFAYQSEFLMRIRWRGKDYD